MEVKITVNKNTLIAAPAGEIDHHSAAAVRKQIDDAYEESRCTDIVFDMNRVEFMDSSGIGMMIGRCKNMDFTGGEVRAEHMNGRIRKIFLLSGLHKMVKIEEGGEEE